MKYKTYSHNPPHLFRDKSPYFITGGTHNKQRFWFDDERKQILFNAIDTWIRKFEWAVEAWVIFHNHYHLLACSRRGEDLGTIIGKIHGRSATLLNKLDGCQGRQVWWNYWDRCIRDEKDHLAYLSYILWNPAKHKIVDQPDEYAWSNYLQIIEADNSQEKALKENLNHNLLESESDDF